MLEAIQISTLKTRMVGKAVEVFDPCRKKWFLLQPEEMVRQQVINHLHKVCKVPYSLMRIEQGVQVGEMTRRFDIVVQQNTGLIWMLVECKAPTVGLNDKVVQQALAYTSALQSKYIMLSNGHETIGWQSADNRLFYLEEWPVFE